MLSQFVLGKILYWICWPLLLSLLGVAGWQAARSRELLRKPAFLAIFLFLLGLQWITLRPSHLKVLWDETVVYSTSISMALGHSAYMPIMALPSEQGLKPVDYNLDRRPPFYPFLLSLIHGLAEPKESNGATLNQGVYSLLLLGIAGAAAGFPLPTAAGAGLLVAAIPILPWLSSSGGIDLLGVCLTIWFLYLWSLFWGERTIRAFLLMLAPAAAAAYTRYELLGLIGPLLAIGAWANRHTKHFRASLFLLLLFSFSMIPLLMLLTQIKSSLVDAGTAPIWSLQYLQHSIPNIFHAFLKPGFQAPYGGWLGIMGLACLVIATKRKKLNALGFAFLLSSLLQLGLLAGYFWGNAMDSASARLFLLPAISLALSPLLLAGSRKAGWAIFLLGMSCFTAGSFSYRGQALFQPSPEMLIKAQMDPALEAAPLFSPKNLLVWNLYFYVISRGKPTINPEAFLKNAKALLERQAKGQIGEIFWIRSPVDDPYKIALDATREMEKGFRWEDTGFSAGDQGVKAFRLIAPISSGGPLPQAGP